MKRLRNFKKDATKGPKAPTQDPQDRDRQIAKAQARRERRQAKNLIQLALGRGSKS